MPDFPKKKRKFVKTRGAYGTPNFCYGPDGEQASCLRVQTWGLPSDGVLRSRMARASPLLRRGYALRQAQGTLALASLRVAAPRIARRAKRGGADRDRTDDLVIANDALFRLSYSPITS
jgi:hypothetical protein